MGLVQHHAVKGGGDGLQGLPFPAFHTAQKFSLEEGVSRLLLGIPIAAGLYGFIVSVLHLPGRFPPAAIGADLQKVQQLEDVLLAGIHFRSAPGSAAATFHQQAGNPLLGRPAVQSVPGEGLHQKGQGQGLPRLAGH